LQPCPWAWRGAMTSLCEAAGCMLAPRAGSAPRAAEGAPSASDTRSKEAMLVSTCEWGWGWG
jgi:hypothetical protein